MGCPADDVARANAILSVPVNPAFASLNLSQAALIAAYEWSRFREYPTEVSTVGTPLSEEPIASREGPFERLIDHLRI